MTKLEDLATNAALRGVLPDALVTVVNVKWFGSSALELTYKDPSGLKFDATPIFPKRIAYTVPYKLSAAQAALYRAVTEYVREEFSHRVHYVRRPFQREPDFGVTSSNYDFKELLARAEVPK